MGMVDEQHTETHEDETWPGQTAPADHQQDRETSIKQIGPFEIIRALGSGGMGTVYEAVREQPRQTVAIKLLKYGIGSDLQRQRFDRECEFLAALHHSNIAQLYDVGIHDADGESVPYFVMEFIESSRAITRYAFEEKLPIRDRVNLFCDVCDAIQHGHEKGILHRDLKPDNLLVNAEGQVKVIDFGVARALTDDLGGPQHTSTGQIVGTIYYMSPEQVDADSSHLDARSDVYSLGVVLYELLTGRLPYTFKGTSIVSAARVIRDAAVTRPSKHVHALKGDLDSILLKALSKRRDNRYATVADLMADLRRYLNSEPLLTRRTASLYLVRHSADRFMLRHPISAALVTLMLAGLLAEFLGVPLIYNWTGAHKQYVKQLSALIPIETTSASFDHVRIVRLDDASVANAAERARQLDAPEVRPDEDWYSMRVLHGRFMQRLAAAGVRVLAWDINFVDPYSYDAELVAGVKAMHEAGSPVVIAVPTWVHDAEGYPQITRVLVPHVRWGCTSAWFDDAAPWEIELAIYRQTGQTIASLGLNTASAWWHPDWKPAYVFDPNEDSVLRIDFYRSLQDNPSVRVPLGQARRITLTSNWIADTADADFGIFEDDFIGYFGFPIPSDAVLDASSVSYDWVFQATDNELRDTLRGKAVFVGDFRSEAGDHYPLSDGRDLHGCYGHAAAVEAMLQGSVILDERTSLSRIGIVVFALFGLLIGWSCANRPVVRFVILSVLAVLLALAAVTSYRNFQYIMNPFVPFLGAVLACEIGARITRLRRSYFA